VVAPGYYSHPRTQMRAFVPDQARTLLDVGCGDGAFADGLREQRRQRGRYLEVWGLELDPDAAARASERMDRVLVGDAEDLVRGLPAGFFDCVILNDVVEHLAWPEPLLASLRRVLAPGGCLVASIPNVRHFPNVWDLAVRGDWEYREEGILDRTHLRFYTRESMRGLFARSGYRVVTQAGINPTRSWRFRLANALALGRLRDMQFLQYACVAIPEPETPA